jgi:response regulator RpfG family c-di-GMP phosphodiesterase
MLKYRELLNELLKLSEEQLDDYIIVSADDQHQIGCELIIADDDLYDRGRYTRKEIENSE